MDAKPKRFKGKNKKQAAKPKNPKNRKACQDGQTCTMFLNDLTRKFLAKKKLEEEEEERVKIVETIIESITNALPFKFSKKSISSIKPTTKEEPQNAIPQKQKKEETPMDVDNGSLAQEVFEKDVSLSSNTNFTKQPRMPVVNSIDLFPKAETFDAAVNTTVQHDVAYEITKHVGTLKKIALIAEDFNQKTAQNLKEIVNSVQDDLIRKLEEVRQTKIAAATADTIDGENEIIV